MKFTWLSNAPWTHTGYGVQTKLFIEKFVEMGHEPAVLAFYGLEGAILNLGKVPVYSKGFDPFGNDIVRAHTKKHGAEVCLSLMDAWVLRPEMFDDIKWIPWFPVDSEPCPRPVLEKVSHAYRRITMSKFGLQQMHNAGLDAYYIPHGVDTELYKPYGKAEAREALGFPKDAYIVGMVAANKGFPSRKAFTPQLEAFANFKRRHSDAVLYMHTFTSEHGEFGGVNLVEFIELVLGLEVGKDVLFPNQYDMMYGFYKEQTMAQIYSAMDVHMLVSMGEGFGIPTLEAQACGTPVITSGWTASEELCFSGRTVSKKDADPFYTPQAAYQYKPRIRAVELALEAEYKKPSSGKKARAGALEYDADKIAEEYWKPTLAEIEESLDA